AETFLRFLKKIYRKYPKKHLHVIADNLNVHKHKAIREWVNSKKRMTLHFTPTYSSWLNQIVDVYNKERAKPFEWTYDGTKNSSINN
ncbi:MAG: transposase, partial [Bacteroidota bacterium]